MKQLSQNLRTGKLSVEEVSPPAVQPGQVLVQTAFSLISAGTERSRVETGRKSLIGKALARPDQVRQVVASLGQVGLKSTYEKVMTRLDSRTPLGYSASGVVVEVGAGVEEFHVGDKVACGGATACHTEMMAVPRNLCVPVVEGVSLEHAAFTTVGAIALQGLRQADLRIGEYAAVIGLGLLGQITVQLLRAAGCSVIGFDPDEARGQLALQFGAVAASRNLAAFKNKVVIQTGSKGVDAVLITAGTSSNTPVELAGEICRDKGRVVVVGAVGLTIPREPYYKKELDLRLSRSYGPGRYDPAYEEQGLDYPYGYVRWTERRNMAAFLALVAEGKVNLVPLITHRFPLEQAAEAYALIRGKGSGPSMGVLFEYPQTPLPSRQVIPMAMSSARVEGRLSIGVIGAGNFAQSMLLPGLKKNPQGKLLSVTTLDPLQSRDVAERFGFANTVSTPQELLDDPSIRGVLITTRHDSHAGLVLQALQAGKAIHVEKPLAMNQEELQQILEAYTQAQGKGSAFVNVGFNRRFAPLSIALKQFFASRQEPISVLYRINAGFIPLDHWTQDPRQGGGRIIGEVCHFIDLVQFFCGAEVEQVFASALPDQGKYHTDNLSLSLKLADGSIGTIVYLANGDKALLKEYIEVSGQGKVAILEDFRRLKLISGGRIRSTRQGGQNKGHHAEMDAWVAAIREGNPEPVPFAQAVTATRATFAVLRSLAEGRPVNVDGFRPTSSTGG